MSERGKMEEALRELVRLKDVKERIENGTADDLDREDYEGNKEPAWQAARDALTALPAPPVAQESVPDAPKAGKADGWQPIETTNNHWKWVQLWWPHVTDAALVGYCVNGQWHSAPDGSTWPVGPTHWQPLPPAPAVSGVVGKGEA